MVSRLYQIFSLVAHLLRVRRLHVSRTRRQLVSKLAFGKFCGAFHCNEMEINFNCLHRYLTGQPALPEPPPAHGRATEPTPRQRRRFQTSTPGYPAGMPQTPIGVPGYPAVMRQTPVGLPGYPVRTPERPLVTRDPVVVWDPAKRQRYDLRLFN